MVASLIWAAFPLGGTIGGFLNGFLLAKFGWQAIFVVGGVLPLIVAAALALWLPESLRFLLSKGDAQEKSPRHRAANASRTSRRRKTMSRTKSG